MSKKNDQPKNITTIFFGTMVKTFLIATVIGLLIRTGFSYVKQKAVKTASEAVVTEAIKEAASSAGVSVSDEQIQQVLDSMDEEDQEALEEIISGHMDSDLVKKATEAATSGDASDLMNYADQELSDDEKATLQALYNKYGDQVFSQVAGSSAVTAAASESSSVAADTDSSETESADDSSEADSSETEESADVQEDATAEESTESVDAAVEESSAEENTDDASDSGRVEEDGE